MSLTSLPKERADAAVAPAARLIARVQNGLVALLLLVFLVLGWRGRDPVQIGAGDDLIYLSLSRSLESGSYREIFRASAPLHVKYPPGYPAWLVLVRHATGDRLDLILASNLLLVALSFVILFVMARRLGGVWLALALLLLMALSPGLLWMGGSMYSEALFLLLSTSTLAAALKADQSNRRATVLTAVALALLAFLTRTAGIALVAAVGIWLWSRRKPVELMVYGLSSAIVVGGWFTYAATFAPDASVRSYANDLADGIGATHAGWAIPFVSRVWHNAVSYGTEILPTELSVPTIPGTLVDNWIWLGIEVALLIAGIVFLWRSLRVAAAYLLLFAGVLVLWPWAIGRLLVPVIPLVLLTLLLGGRQLARRLPARARGLVLGCLVAFLFFGAVRGAIGRVASYSQCDRTNPYESPGCFDAETRSVAAAANYIRSHAAPTDVVLAVRPAGVQFLSGHLGEPAALLQHVPAGDAARALRERSIHHVLLTALSPYEKRTFARILMASCSEFHVEAHFAPHAILLSPSVPPGTATDACAAVAEYMRENPDSSHLPAP